MNYFFSIHGRIGRLEWWAGQFVILAIMFATAYIMGKMEGSFQVVLDFLKHDHAKLSRAESYLLFYSAVILCIWIYIAVSVKRLHDRNKSGWWALLYLIPNVGGILAMVECGCLAGTGEANRFDVWEADSAAKKKRQTKSTEKMDIDELIATRLMQRHREQTARQEVHVSAVNRFDRGKPVFGQRR